MEVINAVVLAGGGAEKNLKNEKGRVNEAFISIGGRCMVDYVVEALKQSISGKIALVGPVKKLRESYGKDSQIILVSGGDTVIESVMNGLEALSTSGYVLITSSDIPLITSAVLINFINSCSEAGEADLYYPIISRQVNEKRYPGAKRTYVRFREGVYTGGNVFLIRPEIVKPRVEFAEKLISMRKSPLKLCWMIGWGFIIKLFLGRLSLKQVERRFSSFLDIKGKAVPCEYAELGMDIDKESDLKLVEQVLTTF